MQSHFTQAKHKQSHDGLHTQTELYSFTFHHFTPHDRFFNKYNYAWSILYVHILDFSTTEYISMIVYLIRSNKKNKESCMRDL